MYCNCTVLYCTVLKCAAKYCTNCNYTFVLKPSQFDLTPLHSAPPCSILLYSTHSLTVSIHPFGHSAIQQHIPSLPSPSPASFICCDFRKPLHSFLNIRTAVQQTWITSGAIQNGVPITVFLLAIVSFDKETKYSQDRFLPWKSLLQIFNLYMWVLWWPFGNLRSGPPPLASPSNFSEGKGEPDRRLALW